MTSILRYDSDADCIFLRIEGLVTIDRIRELTSQVAQLCEKSECWRVLNDLSDASIDLSISKYLSSSKFVDKLTGFRSVKKALVAPDAFLKCGFLGGASADHCTCFEIFRDVESAMQWLLNNKPDQQLLPI
jgi:hypothetical protein